MHGTVQAKHEGTARVRGRSGSKTIHSKTVGVVTPTPVPESNVAPILAGRHIELFDRILYLGTNAPYVDRGRVIRVGLPTAHPSARVTTRGE
jgi:hypothetical protein